MAVVLAIAAAIWYADNIVTSIADGKIKEQLSKDSLRRISYDKLEVRLMQGAVNMYGINVCQSDSVAPTNKYPGMWISAESVELSGINWFSLKKKKLDIHSIEVNSLTFRQTLPKNQPKKPTTQTDTAKITAKITDYISRVEIDKFILNGANIKYRDLSSKLSLTTDSLSVQLHDLAYNLTDSTFTIDDEHYMLHVGKTDLTAADGLMALALNSLTTQDAGRLVLTGLHAYNTVPKEKLADLKGKIPVTWVDARLKKIESSPINIITLIKNKNVDIEQIVVQGDNVHLCRDIRYKAKEPYTMPQQDLLAVTIPLSIKTIKVSVPHLETNMTTDGEHYGVIPIQKINATINNICNKPDNELKSRFACELFGGKADMYLSYFNDKDYSFILGGSLTDVRGEALEPFSRPMLGATLQCRLHELKMDIKGNSIKSAGKLCMQYDSLQVHILKDESPLRMLAKNAGLINTFAPIVIQKSNPRAKGKEPVEYEVSATRDCYNNIIGYFSQNIVDGVMHTVLGNMVYDMVKDSRDKNKKSKK